MGREILFRAKCFGNWRYGCYVHFDKKPTNDYCNINYKDFIITNEDDGEHYYPITDLSSISQYIGLNDINGTKIFEGDIIEGLKYKHFIKYDNVKASYVAINVNYSEDSGCSIDEQWINECDKTVIGNIFDNNELIKQL
jgi:hypothetical protein